MGTVVAEYPCICTVYYSTCSVLKILYRLCCIAAAAAVAGGPSEEELQQLAEASTVARVTKGILTEGGWMGGYSRVVRKMQQAGIGQSGPTGSQGDQGITAKGWFICGQHRGTRTHTERWMWVNQTPPVLSPMSACPPCLLPMSACHCWWRLQVVRWQSRGRCA
jgi:hypothetical protein